MRQTFLACTLFAIATTAFAQNDQPSTSCNMDWQHLATGIDYRPITCLGDPADLDLHVVHIARRFFTFDVADVTGGSTARQEAGKRNAAFVINGNFFAKDRTPIGVIVRSGDELQPAHASSWQAIFLIDSDGDPHIIRIRDWRTYRHRAQMAVQAGPRIVVHGRINKVNRSYSAARSGVCIESNGDLTFFATPQERKFDMWEIGRIVRRGADQGGLGCRDAMLFDGGHSTQIYIAGDSQTMHVDGDPVPVFVFATRKQ